MNYNYEVGGKRRSVRIDKDGDTVRVSIDRGEPRKVRVVAITPRVIEFEISGTRRRLHVVRSDNKRLVADGSEVFELVVAARGSNRKSTGIGGGQAGGSLEAAMPGQVISVVVQYGDQVVKGQTLLIIEAMKMELRVLAPHAGRVQRVLVKTGDVVERGQQLVEVVPQGEV